MTPPNTEKFKIDPVKNLSERTVTFLSFFPDTVFTYIADHGQANTYTSQSHVDLEAQSKGYGIYFSVNGFKDNRRVSENIISVNAFFCDIDFPKHIEKTPEKVREYKQDIQMELLSGEKPAPTFIVETKNGLHVYWCFDKPILISNLREDQKPTLMVKYREIEEAILKKFDGDLGAKDIARVLRVPETLHQKDEHDPFKVKIISYQPDNVYKYKEIRDAFLVTETVPGWVTVSTEKDNLITPEIKKTIEEKYPKLKRASYKGLLDQTAIVPEGIRNKALLIIAYACKDSGWSLDKTLNFFPIFYGLHIREIRKTVRSAYQHEYDFGYKNEVMSVIASEEEREKLSKTTSDILSKAKKVETAIINDNQKKMYLTYEEVIADRYPHLKYKIHGDFYDYENGVYRMLQISEIQSLVLREMLCDGLTNYRQVSSVNDKLACFKSLEGRTFSHDEENKDSNILNFRNGMLDLTTLEMIPHTPDYLSTIQIPIAYTTGTKAPQWEKFIDEIMEGDIDQKKLLQQLAGYILTADVRYAKAFILYGYGANGKSLFLRLVSKIIGVQNVSNINLTTLTKHFGLTGLVGKRLNIIDEISGNYFESNIIKAIISGERISTDIKFRPEPLEFDPIVKLAFSVNELPKINDTTPGLYRRFIIIPFTRTFSRNPDLELENKLTSEREGILEWALAGLRMLRLAGRFNETARNTDAMKAFKTENSPVAEFLQGNYELAPVTVADQHHVLVSELYRQYKEFCITNGYKPKAMANFMRELLHTNIENFTGMQRKIINRATVIEGLRPLATFVGEEIKYNNPYNGF